MTTPRPATINRDRLAKHDLRWALLAPLGEVYKDPRKGHTTRFKELTLIVRYLQSDLWDSDPTQALMVVMRQAVKGLPDGKPKNSLIDWKEVGKYLCGFKEKPPERDAGEWRAYTHYLDAMCKVAGIRDRKAGQFRREVTRKFKEHLADVLLQLKPEDFPAESLSSPRQATISPAFAPPLVYVVPPLARPERLAEHDSPLKRVRRIAQVRLTLGVTILVLIGAALGLLVVPRLYEPSQIWQGPFREPSLFVISSFWLLAPIVCVAALLVIWLLVSALVNWRALSRQRAVLCISLGMVVIAPAYLVGSVEFAHIRETDEAAALSNKDPRTLWMSQEFDRVNNPSDGFAACTSRGEMFELPLRPDSSFVSCDEINDALTLRAINGQSFSAQLGDYDFPERDSYSETLFRPNYMGYIWAGCGISIVPTDDPSVSRNLTLEIAQDENALQFRPVVIEYTNRGTLRETAQVLQRSPLVLPRKADGGEFDQSPREGWLKLGVLREGDRYKLFINDHLVLTHTWAGGPGSVLMRIEAHADQSVAIGYRGCSFDYFRQWLLKD